MCPVTDAKTKYWVCDRQTIFVVEYNYIQHELNCLKKYNQYIMHVPC
jgi:hypothetical protein